MTMMIILSHRLPFVLSLIWLAFATLSFVCKPANAFLQVQKMTAARTMVLEIHQQQQRHHQRDHHRHQRPFALVELPVVPAGDCGGGGGGGAAAAAADDDDDDDDDDDGDANGTIIPSSIVEEAKVQLSWEKIQSVNNKPILNLSMRDASPEQQQPEEEEEQSSQLFTSGEWESGQQWKETVVGLRSDDLNCSIPDEIVFLQGCPQLYRLGTSDILETARWLQQEFGAEYLSSTKKTTVMNPRILSYKVDDLQYGLEFIGVMMMMPNSPDVVKSMCMKSSDFFIEAVEGGIQERAVSSALGNAGKATYSASQNVASDAMSSLRQLKETRRNKT